MKTPMTWLLIATVVFLFVIAYFTLNTATSASSLITAPAARTPSLIAGITSLLVGSGLVVFGIVFFSKRE